MPSSILEYLTRDDADAAVKTLDGKDLRGQPVRVALTDDPVRRTPAVTTFVKPFLTVFPAQRGPPDYRRDDRYRDERYERGDRYRDPPPRRDRSRSPYRRDYDRYDEKRYDDRRPRSPPPRRDLDDRRQYDDRRDSRRDDRRDLDDRRNGDGGWHRSGGRLVTPFLIAPALTPFYSSHRQNPTATTDRPVDLIPNNAPP